MSERPRGAGSNGAADRHPWRRPTLFDIMVRLRRPEPEDRGSWIREGQRTTSGGVVSRYRRLPSSFAPAVHMNVVTGVALEDPDREFFALLVPATHPHQDPAVPDLFGVVVLVVLPGPSRQ